MPPANWKTFALFAAAMLGISFLDERIAVGIVIVTGIVIIVNHYAKAAATPGGTPRAS